MPRKAYLEPDLSSAQLKQRYQHCREPVESRRWHLLWLVWQNWQIKAAAAAVGLNYDYAKDIVQAYNQQGIESMKNRRRQPGRRGTTPLLSPTQISELQQALRQPPPDSGIWSGPKVAQWISQKTGQASVRAQRGWDYLKRCRFTRTARPRPRHVKADVQAQATFKADLPTEIEQLQQQYSDASLEVWAFDEHRVGLKPIVRWVWAPIGERPLALVHHRACVAVRLWLCASPEWTDPMVDSAQGQCRLVQRSVSRIC